MVTQPPSPPRSASQRVSHPLCVHLTEHIHAWCTLRASTALPALPCEGPLCGSGWSGKAFQVRRPRSQVFPGVLRGSFVIYATHSGPWGRSPSLGVSVPAAPIRASFSEPRIILNDLKDSENDVFFFFKLWVYLFYLFIYLWLCWVFVSVRGLSLVAASGGHSSSRCAGLSLSRPLLLRSTGSRRAGSVIAAHGPSCSVACGIPPDQGPNPRPLHCQADSQPLRHQGSPENDVLSDLKALHFHKGRNVIWGKEKIYNLWILFYFKICLIIHLQSFWRIFRKRKILSGWQGIKLRANFIDLTGLW